MIYQHNNKRCLEIAAHRTQNFILWRAVWTPILHHQDTALNDLLTKGTNNFNKLQEILIRWSLHKIGIHTDISKMYNTVGLTLVTGTSKDTFGKTNLTLPRFRKKKSLKPWYMVFTRSGNQAELGLQNSWSPQVRLPWSYQDHSKWCLRGWLHHRWIRHHWSLQNFRRIGSHNKQRRIQTEGYHNIRRGSTFASHWWWGINWCWWLEVVTDEISLCISELNFSQKRRGLKALSMLFQKSWHVDDSVNVYNDESIWRMA